MQNAMNMLSTTTRCAARFQPQRRRLAQRPLARFFTEERDIEVPKTEAQFVALLRRVADSVEANKGWRIQVGGLRLKVPETAKVSVEHEASGNNNCIEFQFKWSKTTDPATQESPSKMLP